MADHLWSPSPRPAHQPQPPRGEPRAPAQPAPLRRRLGREHNRVRHVPWTGGRVYTCPRGRESILGRDDVVQKLAAHKETLAGMGVRSLSVFGSVARDEATAQSDVDILVDFGGPTSFDRYMDLKFYLEELLGARVDLVTERGLKPRARPYVQQDAIRVA